MDKQNRQGIGKGDKVAGGAGPAATTPPWKKPTRSRPARYLQPTCCGRVKALKNR